MTDSIALEENRQKEKFATHLTKTYDKVIARTRNLSINVKMSDLV
jgi:hypothetical protein